MLAEFHLFHSNGQKPPELSNFCLTFHNDHYFLEMIDGGGISELCKFSAMNDSFMPKKTIGIF